MITRKQNYRLNENHWSAPLVTLGVLLVVTFALGGSARGDEAKIIMLRPASVIAFLIALYFVDVQQIKKNRFWLAWWGSLVVLVVLHLVPLPPMLWHQLPGRELPINVDILLSRPQTWRPLTLSPELTRNALWSLPGPLACFLLMIQLPRKGMIRAFLLVVLLGLVSGLVSVLQTSQGSQSIFYLYRVTNFGSGVGLFANRNHQAVLLACLIPIGFGIVCYFLTTERKITSGLSSPMVKWVITLVAVFVFSLVLVTGSRAGLLLYGLALILTVLYASSRVKSELLTGNPRLSFSGANWKALVSRYALLILPLIVTASVLLSGRADTLKRLTSTVPGDEPRLTIFEPLVGAVIKFMPTGSGVGSFDPVFRGFETKDLLAPNYWNHAHNDWIEAIMTAGVPAILIALIGIVRLIKYFAVLKTMNPRVPEYELSGFIGGSVLVVLAMSSFVEYPLRVPIISCVFAMAIALISNDSVLGERDK